MRISRSRTEVWNRFCFDVPLRRCGDSYGLVNPVELMQVHIFLAERQPDRLSFLFAALQLKKIIPLRRKQADTYLRSIRGNGSGELLPELGNGNGHTAVTTFDRNRRRCVMTGFCSCSRTKFITTKPARNPPGSITVIATLPVFPATGVLVNFQRAAVAQTFGMINFRLPVDQAGGRRQFAFHFERLEQNGTGVTEIPDATFVNGSVRIVKFHFTLHMPGVVKGADSSCETQATRFWELTIEHHSPSNRPCILDLLVSELGPQFLTTVTGQYKLDSRFLNPASQHDVIVFQSNPDYPGRQSNRLIGYRTSLVRSLDVPA